MYVNTASWSASGVNVVYGTAVITIDTPTIVQAMERVPLLGRWYEPEPLPLAPYERYGEEDGSSSRYSPRPAVDSWTALAWNLTNNSDDEYTLVVDNTKKVARRIISVQDNDGYTLVIDNSAKTTTKIIPAQTDDGYTVVTNNSKKIAMVQEIVDDYIMVAANPLYLIKQALNRCLIQGSIIDGTRRCAQ